VSDPAVEVAGALPDPCRSMRRRPQWPTKSLATRRHPTRSERRGPDPLPPGSL